MPGPKRLFITLTALSVLLIGGVLLLLARPLRNEETPDVAAVARAALPSAAAGNVGAATSTGIRLGAALDRMRWKLLKGISLVVLLLKSAAVAALLKNELPVVVPAAPLLPMLKPPMPLLAVLVVLMVLGLLLLLPTVVVVAAVVLVINFFSLRAIVVLCHW